MKFLYRFSVLKTVVMRLPDHEGLFPKGRNKNSIERIERPLDVQYRFRAGRSDVSLNGYVLLGLSIDEF